MTVNQGGTVPATEAAHHIPVLRRGAWVQAPDPVSEGSRDVDADLRASGWRSTRYLGGEYDSITLKIWSCERVGCDPQFLLDVSIDGEMGAFMGAGDMVDLGDLLSTWIPIARDAMITSLLSDIENSEFSEANAFSRIAALSSYGVDRAGGWAFDAAQRRERDRQWRQAQAKSSAAGSSGGTDGRQ